MSVLVGRTLLDRRRALVAWSLSVGLIGALFMFVWPSLEGSIGDLLESYPDALKKAFGFSSLATAEEYLDAELFSVILPFALAIMALRAVSSAIPSAEERGYLDVLLSAPVGRGTLVASTFAAIAVEVAIVLAAGWALTCLASAIAGAGLSVGLAAAGFATVWPLALFGAGVAILASGLSQRPGTVTAIAAGTLVAMYVVDLVGRIADGLEPLRWLSVFKYYGSAATDGLDPLGFVGVCAAALALVTVGAALFERRDLGA